MRCKKRWITYNFSNLSGKFFGSTVAVLFPTTHRLPDCANFPFPRIDVDVSFVENLVAFKMEFVSSPTKCKQEPFEFWILEAEISILDFSFK